MKKKYRFRYDGFAAIFIFLPESALLAVVYLLIVRGFYTICAGCVKCAGYCIFSYSLYFKKTSVKGKPVRDADRLISSEGGKNESVGNEGNVQTSEV